MRTFTEYFNSKAMETIVNIIKAEDLNVTLTIEDSTLGDTMIVVKGELEDIEILEDVYNMVK